MDHKRLERQLRFSMECDKMKNIARRTLLADGSRRETDAEHSWHLAVLALLLAEYAQPDVDVDRAVRMCLVHDIIEIDAGDTFAYDVAGNRTKAAREAAAADRLFAILPEDQGRPLRALWEEFDAMHTPDALYANCCDRLQPLLNNLATGGHTWEQGRVARAQVDERIAVLQQGMPSLFPLVEEWLNDAVAKGWLLP